MNSISQLPDTAAQLPMNGAVLAMLRCPLTGQTLRREGSFLSSEDSSNRYEINELGIPLFAAQFCSEDARIQQSHYESIASAYIDNLDYPHTKEYTEYLDTAFLAHLDAGQIRQAAEICCGRGEAFRLLEDRVDSGMGVDISASMLVSAVRELPSRFAFVQGDATMLPLADGLFDAVFMFGGIHHVNDREKLFSEVGRVLRPGGKFYWREPVSDFFLWRWLRSVIYRLSPVLDHETERPLQYAETIAPLNKAGLRLMRWQTYGFLGFCLFMNSDVLFFNRLFRFVPGIRTITRFAARLDDLTLRLPFLKRAGLQVVGVAEKPASPDSA